MNGLKSLAFIVMASIPVWLSAATPGSAGIVVVRSYDPPGMRCFRGNGWHYDQTGHHLFGPYRQCRPLGPAAATPPVAGHQAKGYTVTVVRRYYYPNGHCVSGHGWHYDPFGNRVNGFWRSCNPH